MRAHQRSSEFEDALMQARKAVEHSHKVSLCGDDVLKALKSGNSESLLTAWQRAKALVSARKD